jgi:mannose-1-phosphate guanylyltransferase
MAKEEKFAVILAGGGGTRLWPLSRKKTPKQLLKLLDGKTLLRETFERINGFYPLRSIHVITSAELLKGVVRELPELPKNNILIEPYPKGTAAAAGLAALYIARKNKEGIISVFASDHVIKDKMGFLNTLSLSTKEAAKGNYIVTIGIKPKSAATGLGYIRVGGSVSKGKSRLAQQVMKFTEKPSSELARKYITSGQYYWNANINSYKASTILSSIKKYFPELFEVLQLVDRKESKNKILSLWRKLPPKPIDTAILEKASNVLMVTGDFDWWDVGDWDTLYSLLSKSKGQNVVIGEDFDHIDLGSRGCLLHGDKGLVATIGLENLIIVKADDVIFVAPSSQSSEVKTVVAKLIKKRKNRFL